MELGGLGDLRRGAEEAGLRVRSELLSLSQGWGSREPRGTLFGVVLRVKL